MAIHNNKSFTLYDQWAKAGVLSERLFLMEAMCMEGHTQAEIAKELGIGMNTLLKLKERYKDVAILLSRTKRMVDYQIEKSLYEKAKEGDVSAMKFWLMNRKSDLWKDRRHHDHNVNKTVVIFDDEEELED